MALTFDTSVGVGVEDTEVVRERIRQNWVNAFKDGGSETELVTDAETPAGQLIDGETALVSEKDTELLQLANGFNPKTATGVFQDALAQIYFLERHVAEPTYVTCQCKGLQGTTIPYGAVVQDTDGNTFYNTVPGTIDSTGVYETTFRCSEYGEIEVGAGAVTKIITVIPGWDSVSNEAAGVTGREMETQAEFESRRYDSVSKNAHGTAASVQGTVGDLDDVIAAVCAENRSHSAVVKYGVTIPDHSIYLSVYGGDAEEIAYAVYAKLGGGCGMAGNTEVTITDPTTGAEATIYFEVPTTVAIGLKVTYVPTASTPTTIEDDIREAVLENFNGQTATYGRAKMGDDIYATRFVSDVIAAGVENLVSVQISYDGGEYGDSVSIPLDRMPTLDGADIVIEEAE